MTTPKRPRVWVDTQVNGNLVAGAETLIDLLLSQVVDSQVRTVVRWIGRIRVFPTNVANSVISAQLVSLGIGITSRDAFAAAGGAVPSPAVLTEFPTQGWVIREQAVMINQQDSGTVEAWEFPEFRFDIRASRKVDRGIAFAKLVNEDLVAGTTTVSVVGMIRSLVLV